MLKYSDIALLTSVSCDAFKKYVYAIYDDDDAAAAAET